MKYLNKFYSYKLLISLGIVLLGVLFSFNSVFSQEFIKAPDTTLFRNGSTYSLPIYSNLNLTNVSSIKIIFRYNSLLLDFKNVSGGSNFAFAEANPTFSINNTELTNSIIEVSCNNLNSNYLINNFGTLFNFNVETLAGPDSIAVLEPTEIYINGVKSENFGLESGIIKIGEPVYEKINEGTSQIYPNPFYSSATVTFYIKDVTKIKFWVYSSVEKLITSIPGDNSAITYSVFDLNGNQIDDIENYTFTRGLYKLQFTAIPWKFSAGLYFLILETDRGLYENKIIHIK